MYQKYRICVSKFQNVRVRISFRSQSSPHPISPQFSAAQIARPWFFRGQNSPPKVFRSQNSPPRFFPQPYTEFLHIVSSKLGRIYLPRMRRAGLACRLAWNFPAGRANMAGSLATWTYISVISKNVKYNNCIE